MRWQELGARPPKDLTAARVALHHAAQLPALGVGKSLVPPVDDDSHTALDWRADAQQWSSQPIPGSDGLRAGLCPREIALTLGRDYAPAARSLYLPGISREAALTWLRDGLRAEGMNPALVKLEPHYDLPSHPVADRGDVWRADILAGASELARYFGNADSLFADIASGNSEATPILTWPHHFDIGRLLPAGPTEARFDKSIGIGLSPGDGSYAEPYFYVNAYPRPDLRSRRPALSFGHWHTDGFFAAVLTATELLESDQGSQAERAYCFFEEAVDAARRLLASMLHRRTRSEIA